MEFSSSLKNNHEFRRLYSQGKSTSSAYAVVYCRKNRQDVNRLGITVSTKIGHAVVRNRIRRRFREIYRLHEGGFLRGYDIIFVARGRSRDAAFGVLQNDLLRSCKKLGIYSGE